MRVTRCLVLILTFLALPLAAQQLEIHYIDVGWGGSVFVKAASTADDRSAATR